MPSGITAAIYEGKDVSLRDYLMTVGRQMGFAILQRDDDPDAPVKATEAEADTSWHDERLEKAHATLAALPSISREDAHAHADADYAEALKSWEEYRDNKAALRYRYEKMIAAVTTWEPPASMPQIKEYAIKYLRDSIDFDCSHVGDAPTRQTAQEWIDGERKRAEWDIAYHGKEREKTIARTDERNAAIRAFLASLPEPVAA